MKAAPSLIACMGLACTFSTAATIITPNNVTANILANAGSTLPGLINGSNLSGLVATGSDTAAALSVTQANVAIDTSYVTPANGSDYFAAGPIPVLTFTFSSTFNDVDSIIVWNYNQGTGVSGSAQNNSLQTFTLNFYSDTSATNLIGTQTGLSVARALPVTGAGSGPQVAQQVFFAGGVNYDGVQAITMTLTDNYAGQAGGQGGDRVGLSEVRFSQIPETSVSLLTVCGLLGLLRRRR